MQEKKKCRWIVVHWLPFLLFSSIIFFLSNQSALPMPEISNFKNIDKLCHLAAFAVLGAAAVYAMIATKAVNNWRVWFMSILLVSFYGVLDEFHQYFVPNRNVSLRDFIADTAGAIIGVMSWVCWRKLCGTAKTKKT